METLSVPEPAIEETAKRGKTTSKKGGVGFGKRRALTDITNKETETPSVQPSKGKGKLKEEDFDVTKEGFLHDHSKCIRERGVLSDADFFDIVLPGVKDRKSLLDLPEKLELMELTWPKEEEWVPRPLSPVIDFPLPQFDDDDVDFVLLDDVDRIF